MTSGLELERVSVQVAEHFCHFNQIYEETPGQRLLIELIDSLEMKSGFPYRKAIYLLYRKLVTTIK
jgi:hypothetical protein